MNIRITLILLLLALGSCVNTKQATNSSGIIELSDKGDYIRAIRTPAGYYYNNPKDGKMVHTKNMK